MDSISTLQTRMSELVKSGKASSEEVEQLKASLQSMQGQLNNSLQALQAEQGKNAELTAYVARMEKKTKEQEQQISVLVEQVSKLETITKDQQKTIDEQKTENEAAKKTIEEQETVIKDIKDQKEFTTTLSSLQDKYNAAFEKAKAAKGKDECNTFKEAYKYAKQIADTCEGKEAMVKEAGKTYATVMGLKEQVLARAKSDMTKGAYAKCFSGYK
jgi:predicted  nucleic acid-binding Zn-ribbon protein